MQALKEQKLKEERLRAENNPELQKKLEEKLEKEERKKKMKRRMHMVRVQWVCDVLLFVFVYKLNCFSHTVIFQIETRNIQVESMDVESDSSQEDVFPVYYWSQR